MTSIVQSKAESQSRAGTSRFSITQSVSCSAPSQPLKSHGGTALDSSPATVPCVGSRSASAFLWVLNTGSSIMPDPPNFSYSLGPYAARGSAELPAVTHGPVGGNAGKRTLSRHTRSPHDGYTRDNGTMRDCLRSSKASIQPQPGSVCAAIRPLSDGFCIGE